LVLDRATDAAVCKLQPFFDLLAILADRQALFNVGGWKGRISIPALERLVPMDNSQSPNSALN